MLSGTDCHLCRKQYRYDINRVLDSVLASIVGGHREWLLVSSTKHFDSPASLFNGFGTVLRVDIFTHAINVLLVTDDGISHGAYIPALPNTLYTIGVIHTGTQVVFYDGLSAFYAVPTTAKWMPVGNIHARCGA